MQTYTHALLGWGIANLVPSLDRRGRAIIMLAGAAPDLDGLTILGGGEAFSAWHHTLCHNAPFAAICTALAAGFGGPRRWLVAALALVDFHAHIACDLLGSAAPDGSHWTIPYLWPFSEWRLDNPYMWTLNAWQNYVALLISLLWAVWIARRYGRTPLEPFTARGDRAVMEVIDRRLGRDPRPSTPRPLRGRSAQDERS